MTTAPAKRGVGRPAEVPTAERRALAKALAGYGVAREQIARSMQIDKKTLLKHYLPELEDGLATAASLIAQSLYKAATKGNVTAIIWWEKTRLGMTDRTALEHSGPKGGPITHEHEITFDPSPLAALSDEDLAAVISGSAPSLPGGGSGAGRGGRARKAIARPHPQPGRV